MNEQEFIEKWPRLYEESGYEAALQYLQEIHHQVATSGATRGDSRLHGVVLCELGSLSQFGGRITEAETYYRFAGEVTGREDMATYQTALMYYHQVGDFVKTLSLMDSIRPQPGPMTKFRIAELLNYLALKGMALAKLDKDSEAMVVAETMAEILKSIPGRLPVSICLDFLRLLMANPAWAEIALPLGTLPPIPGSGGSSICASGPFVGYGPWFWDLRPGKCGPWSPIPASRPIPFSP